MEKFWLDTLCSGLKLLKLLKLNTEETMWYYSLSDMAQCGVNNHVINLKLFSYTNGSCGVQFFVT